MISHVAKGLWKWHNCQSSPRKFWTKSSPLISTLTSFLQHLPFTLSPSPPIYPLVGIGSSCGTQSIKKDSSSFPAFFFNNESELTVDDLFLFVCLCSFSLSHSLSFLLSLPTARSLAILIYLFVRFFAFFFRDQISLCFFRHCSMIRVMGLVVKETKRSKNVKFGREE